MRCLRLVRAPGKTTCVIPLSAPHPFRTVTRTSVALAIFVLIGFGKANSACADDSIPTIEFVLQNGLRVILHEDHRQPYVAINVEYSTGSFHSPADRSGMTSVIDDLMWRWVGHLWPYPAGYYLMRSGAFDYGGNFDTNRSYLFETIHKVNIETALWIESERMGFLLPNAWDWYRKTVPELVAEDLTRSSESQPYWNAWENLNKQLFPAPHPYHYSFYADPQQVRKISLSDATKHYQSFYGPNNATLVIAGDFEPQTMQSLVRDYFNSLPPGKAGPPPTFPPAVIQGSRILHYEEELGTTPMLMIAWLTPGYGSEGDLIADFVARLLARGEVGRLSQAFDKDADILSISTVQLSASTVSHFVISVSTAKTEVFDRVIRAVYTELDRIVENGVSEEEIQSVVKWERNDILEAMYTMWGKAGLLQRMSRKNYDSPSIQSPLHRFELVDSNKVRDFVKKYLGRHSIQQHVIPKNR